jgi:hypothetical protein
MEDRRALGAGGPPGTMVSSVIAPFSNGRDVLFLSAGITRIVNGPCA